MKHKVPTIATIAKARAAFLKERFFPRTWKPEGPLSSEKREFRGLSGGDRRRPSHWESLSEQGKVASSPPELTRILWTTGHKSWTWFEQTEQKCPSAKAWPSCMSYTFISTKVLFKKSVSTFFLSLLSCAVSLFLLTWSSFLFKLSLFNSLSAFSSYWTFTSWETIRSISFSKSYSL